MSSYSVATLASLTNAGWYAGRTTSTLWYRLYLAVKGYAWFPAVAAFLAEFGGLALHFSDKAGKPDNLHFNASAARAGVDPSWLRDDYAARIGTPNLCIIGAAFSNYMLLFMDDAGRVYGGYDDLLWRVASSGPEAIEALVSNQPFTEIP